VSRRAAQRAGAVEPALHHDPLSGDEILEHFYRPRPQERVSNDRMPDDRLEGRPIAGKPKPTHYKIVCISLYNDDIERLGRLVDQLKARGHTKANKSQLIRAALDQVDLDKIPKSH
jgi:hypothetical protein